MRFHPLRPLFGVGNLARLSLSLLFIFTTIILVGCAGGDEDSDQPTDTSGETVTLAPVETVDILILESFPVQVSAVVNGTFPDDCTYIDEVLTDRDESAYTVSLTTAKRDDVPCNEVETAYTQNVPLDVLGLEAGTYQVSINGMPSSFTLDIDNIPPVAEEDATDEPVPQGDFPPAAFTAQLQLAEQLGIPASEVTLVSVNAEEWPNGCLGLETADEVCSNQIVPGYRITMTAADQTYIFRTDATGETIRAETTLPDQAPGETTPGTATAQADCEDGVAFRRDVTIPDRTRVQANKSFTKTWRLQNAGTCTWTTEYTLVFADGDQMDGPDSIPLTREVAPGTSINLSIDLVAPNERGTYRGEWILRNAEGEPFGVGRGGTDPIWVVIRVPRSGESPSSSSEPPAGTAGVQGSVWHDQCTSTTTEETSPSTPPPGCIDSESGYVADGIRDDSEPVIAGYEISLGQGDCPSTGTAVAFANGEGEYLFNELAAGTYCISIDSDSLHNRPIFMPGRWSFPNEVGQLTVTLGDGEQVKGADFGWDYQFAP